MNKPVMVATTSNYIEALEALQKRNDISALEHDALVAAIESMKHVPCYLDSPCEYQNKDIKIPRVTASGWNRITKRPMDAEEREVWEVEMGEIADEDAYLYENLPEEGEEVLVCTQSGRIFIDTMCRGEGCYFEEYGDIEGIVAWMPLPEPYYGLGQAFDPD